MTKPPNGKKAQRQKQPIDKIYGELQDELRNQCVIALLCRGHVLLEGVPGIAKTLTVTRRVGTKPALRFSAGTVNPAATAPTP